MRKLAVLATALAGVLALAGVAYAVNAYTLTKVSTTPAGAGTPKKPKAKKVVFKFQTRTDDGNAPAPIKSYKIGFQGLKSYAKYFKKCTIADVRSDSFARKCRKAKVGSGVVENFFGTAGGTQAEAGSCVLKLTLYNLGRRGMALRLDSEGAPAPGCPITITEGIRAKFKKARIGGKSSVNLTFDVPEFLRHPAPGLNNAVADVAATVSRKTRKVKVKGKRRKVGYLSSIACGKNKKRTIQVIFTDENGAKKRAKKTTKC